jgi:hypothetical protein
VARDTGFPAADAENDFLRARRRHVLAELATRLRFEPDDVNLVLPFAEVVAALGYAGERYVGLQMVPLDAIVGSVDKTREFDRRFRPTSPRIRERWQRIATAQRRGQAMPPIEVYRIGELHFVRDGHHRVSVAHAMKQDQIEAAVTEVRTVLPSSDISSRGDLLVKDYERIFAARVPLPGAAHARITVSDPWTYAELGEAVEAWGFRYMQDRGSFVDRATVAVRWYEDEYVPVVRMLTEAGLIGRRTDAEAYLRVASERYRLMRTHEWNDEVIERLREKR